MKNYIKPVLFYSLLISIFVFIKVLIFRFIGIDNLLNNHNILLAIISYVELFSFPVILFFAHQYFYKNFKFQDFKNLFILSIVIIFVSYTLDFLFQNILYYSMYEKPIDLKGLEGIERMEAISKNFQNPKPIFAPFSNLFGGLISLWQAEDYSNFFTFLLINKVTISIFVTILSLSIFRKQQNNS